MVMERPTLKDVAHESGVHISTASRALNPRTRSVVNPETVERVTAVARALDYRPHPLGRGLRTNRTMSVGVVIPDVENPLFGPIIAGAESVLVEEGYSMLIGNADRGLDHTETVVSDMLERRVDGLILATAVRGDGSIPELVAGGLKVVLVNRTSEHDGIPAIVGDDDAGIGLIVDHLVSLGHRHIGHIAGPSTLSTGFGRRRAFVSWMHSAGLDPGRIEEASWFQSDPGFEAGLRLLRRHPEITAIVAGNDLLGLGCYLAIRQLGAEVATDVSVTGYNDMPFLDLMQPPMTAVRVPYRQMGRQAASALLSLLSEDGDAAASIRLSPTLVVRGSTAPPRSHALDI
jgi:LacI family transcriptional regulator